MSFLNLTEDDMKQMYSDELAFLSRQAAKTKAERLLELIEAQQRIIENIRKICAELGKV